MNHSTVVASPRATRGPHKDTPPTTTTTEEPPTFSFRRGASLPPGRGKHFGGKTPVIFRAAKHACEPASSSIPRPAKSSAPREAASSWKSASPNKLIIETRTNGTIKEEKKKKKSFCISRESLFSCKIFPSLSFTRSGSLRGFGVFF